MFRNLMIAGAALAMFGAATPSLATAPCRDGHGKFVKCPAKPVATAKAVRCKDGKGKFVKCGTAGAKPA